jgi:hypothetical protein
MISILVFITFLLLLAGLAGFAWAALRFHQRLSFLEEEYRRIRVTSVEDSQQWEKELGELAGRMELIERRAADTSQYPARSINYTQRSQVLRLIRRGDSADQIASTLGVPLGQVRLLMKLPGMSAEVSRGKSVTAS